MIIIIILLNEKGNHFEKFSHGKIRNIIFGLLIVLEHVMFVVIIEEGGVGG